MTRSERYCEDYRLQDLEARCVAQPPHGSPDAGFVEENEEEEVCDE